MRRRMQSRPQPRVSPRRAPNELALRQAHRRVKQQQYEEVRRRHAAGASIREIAAQMKLSRGTVYRYLRSDSDPMARQIGRKPSMLDRYLPYLYRRWQGGCENGLQLWREIKAQGYPGSRKMVAAWVARPRDAPAKNGPRKYQTPAQRQRREQARREQRQTPPSSKQLSYFLLSEPQELNLAEKAALQELKDRSSEIATGYELAQEFMQMVRQLSGGQLEGWLERVAVSKLDELTSFAKGLERDKAVVLAGLTENWSNGAVEGQVNRLKLKKRAMYGRANFDLLDRRVLDAA